MNNTKKRTTLAAIAAVLMAATLVVGAGSFTTAAAFAASNNSGNTVTIQKCKQYGLQSGFDNTQDQDCKNTICTHPGSGAICVSDPGEVTPPTPTTGTLSVTKVVKCLSDKIIIDGCQNEKFRITVTDTNPEPSSFVLGNGDTQLVTLGADSTYTVSELENEAFTTTFSGDCPTGTIAPGDQKTCTITNTEKEICVSRSLC